MEEYIVRIKACEGPILVGYDEQNREYVALKSPANETNPEWVISLTAQQTEMLETALRICRQSIRKA